MTIQYTLTDFIFYLILYSFIGWAVEAFVTSIWHKRFVNHGLLNLPLQPLYGIVAVILMVVLPTMRHRYVLQYVMTFMVLIIVGSLANQVFKNITRESAVGTRYTWGWKTMLLTLGIAGVYLIWYLVLHPLFFTMVTVTPEIIKVVLDITIIALGVIDFFSVMYSMRTSHVTRLARIRQAGTMKLGERIAELIWKRLSKAYPGIEESEDADKEYTFAKGICMDKLIWVFLISAFLGAFIEMVYCRLMGDIWMNRSSLLYGTFSVVWGLGAVVLTVTLQRLAGKEDRKVFLGGFVIGGTYEYLCSVFTEIVFGTVFWDYSWMPLNIGGRTNVLYCIFWGILAVVWIKIIYPPMERIIERFPALFGKILTWVMVVIIACDGILTVGAMIRYSQRQTSPVAQNVVEEFLDENYDDAWMEHRWPNMDLKTTSHN